MSDLDVHEECPHCDDAPPSRQLDAHVARAHADLPLCTARIETGHGETCTCGFRAGHAGGECGTWHASKRDADMGRYIWNDTATGATPHRPPDQSDADVLAKFKRMGAVSHTVVARGEVPPARPVEDRDLSAVAAELTSTVPDSQDTGRRCPRCDCADGAEQCEHCKVCPHADGGPEEPPQQSELDELRADNESLRYQILRARGALGNDEPVDERLSQAEIRAAVAEHEAEAYRNQVQALVRELLRARDVPEEDLPQKVRVIILDEETP